ncbi:hypothetical protein KC341_g48 [Hortaea werneckii]|nr:hypothetical protein KC341_g48 [Hortaea werneckii]
MKASPKLPRTRQLLITVGCVWAVCCKLHFDVVIVATLTLDILIVEALQLPNPPRILRLRRLGWAWDQHAIVTASSLPALSEFLSVTGSSTSPSQGLHSWTTSPHRKHVHPSPSSASMRSAYGFVMSVAALPTIPALLPDRTSCSLRPPAGFWS